MLRTLAAALPLKVLEISQPITPQAPPISSQELLRHVFANSYGQPVEVQYSPPSGVEWKNAILTMSWTVSGRQFDRLVHVTLNGIELWRPSTPEPLNETVNGTAVKDVSYFSNLLHQSGLLQVEIDNIIDEKYTGSIDTSLHIDYYDSKFNFDDSQWWYSDIPSHVSPIFRGVKNGDASGHLPIQPRNTTRALINVIASGDHDEEFWYANTLATQSGPTRLVEVWINGELAGIADPWPIMYTGCDSPSQWSPIVGIKAYDVPAYQIDVTPFLPTIWTQYSEVSVRVRNGYNDERPLERWLVSATLLTWQEEGTVGVGIVSQRVFTDKGSSAENLTNSTWTATYRREVKNEAKLYFKTANETRYETATWSQEISMRSLQVSTQSLWSLIVIGSGSSSYSFGADVWARQHSYPLIAYHSIPDNFSEELVLDRTWQAMVSTPEESGNFTTMQSASSVRHDNTSFYQNEVLVKGPEFTREALAQNRKLVKDTVAGRYSYGNPYADPIEIVSRAQVQEAVAKLNSSASATDTWAEVLTLISERAYEGSFEPFSKPLLQNFSI